MLSQLGRSRARRSEDAEHRVTFADVAGIDEAEDELIEIVDFLKHPGKYSRLGAKIPRDGSAVSSGSCESRASTCPRGSQCTRSRLRWIGTPGNISNELFTR